MKPAVAHSERGWILIGMAECCAAKGYEATTTGDICAEAGVSPTSFEELFADKGECLGAAMESLLEEAWRQLDGVQAPGKSWARELSDGVAALLSLLSERPAFARMALIEAPVAGGRAGTLYASGKAALVAQVERGRNQAENDVPASAGRAALAGAEALVVGQILAGKAEQLGDLAPEVTYMLLAPYMERPESLRLSPDSTATRPHLRAVA